MDSTYQKYEVRENGIRERSKPLRRVIVEALILLMGEW